MDFNLHTLSNGLRVIYKPVQNLQITHCGVVINVGTRNETIKTHGMAHFMEHMLFKGTKKRKAWHILNRLDVVGGELNAYTTKEKTCLYASFVNKHFERSIELLADLICNSSFPDKEIEKEKTVVIDEINMYKDNHDETIYEDLESRLFPNQPLGFTILGSEESLNSFTRTEIVEFKAQWYTPDNIIFVYSGPEKESKVLKLCEKHFSSLSGKVDSTKVALAKVFAEPFTIREQKPCTQSYVCLGGPAYSSVDNKRASLLLLTNLLGGDGMNSRLNMNIREKVGLVYSIEASYSPYVDSGVFSIMYGVDEKYLKRVRKLVDKELLSLCTKKLTPNQLKLAKQQFIGRIHMAEESRASLILALGKNVLEFGKVDTLEEIITKINEITEDDLFEVANEIIHPSKLSEIVYLPEK